MAKWYGIYDVHVNHNTRNYGGYEWVIDGERGRDTFPYSWPECKARAYYGAGLSANSTDVCTGCMGKTVDGRCSALIAYRGCKK